MRRLRRGFSSVIGIRAETYVDSFALTAADITTLHSAPLALVAAPGANKAILVTGAIIQFRYGTVQFTGGGAISFVYHGATVNLLSGALAAATVQAAASATVSPGGPAAALVMTPNVGIDLLAATADFAAGDSTAVVVLFYTVYELKQN